MRSSKPDSRAHDGLIFTLQVAWRKCRNIARTLQGRDPLSELSAGLGYTTPYAVGWEADSPLYGPYTPDQPRNRSHVNDPKLAAMVQAQRRLKDPEARKQ